MICDFLCHEMNKIWVNIPMKKIRDK